MIECVGMRTLQSSRRSTIWRRCSPPRIFEKLIRNTLILCDKRRKVADNSCAFDVACIITSFVQAITLEFI